MVSNSNRFYWIDAANRFAAAFAGYFYGYSYYFCSQNRTTLRSQAT